MLLFLFVLVGLVGARLLGPASRWLAEHAYGLVSAAASRRRRERFGGVSGPDLEGGNGRHRLLKFLEIRLRQPAIGQQFGGQFQPRRRDRLDPFLGFGASRAVTFLGFRQDCGRLRFRQRQPGGRQRRSCGPSPAFRPPVCRSTRSGSMLPAFFEAQFLGGAAQLGYRALGHQITFFARALAYGRIHRRLDLRLMVGLA